MLGTAAPCGPHLALPDKENVVSHITQLQQIAGLLDDAELLNGRRNVTVSTAGTRIRSHASNLCPLSGVTQTDLPETQVADAKWCSRGCSVAATKALLTQPHLTAAGDIDMVVHNLISVQQSLTQVPDAPTLLDAPTETTGHGQHQSVHARQLLLGLCNLSSQAHRRFPGQLSQMLDDTIGRINQWFSDAHPTHTMHDDLPDDTGGCYLVGDMLWDGEQMVDTALRHPVFPMGGFRLGAHVPASWIKQLHRRSSENSSWVTAPAQPEDPAGLLQTAWQLLEHPDPMTLANVNLNEAVQRARLLLTP